jgi:hypothetical protein
MTKCINKNAYKLLNIKKIKNYLDLLDLTTKDKLSLKEYDKRVNNICNIVKF